MMVDAVAKALPMAANADRVTRRDAVDVVRYELVVDSAVTQYRGIYSDCERLRSWTTAGLARCHSSAMSIVFDS